MAAMTDEAEERRLLLLLWRPSSHTQRRWLGRLQSDLCRGAVEEPGTRGVASSISTCSSQLSPSPLM